MKSNAPVILPREEYIEQEYLFKVLRERMPSTATQELLVLLQHEILASTQLPKAMAFMAAALRQTGTMADAMAHMSHYFTPFQTFIIHEAECDEGHFDFQTALQILEYEAKCRAESMAPPGMFLYQFEAISRNRLHYHEGLEAVSNDPVFNEDWKRWILYVRRQLGVVDFAEMIYARSEYYPMATKREVTGVALFGEKEGRIACANRRKDPMYLFAALQRQLNYPRVPHPEVNTNPEYTLPMLVRKVERLEAHLKLFEEETKGGIDITRFYVKDE